ncbi:MAG: diaminopropionate ammonia-lyase [Clostridia bacterium]|nr:diaminopropionate ammonia-lyase [Clostridia bacterium]
MNETIRAGEFHMVCNSHADRASADTRPFGADCARQVRAFHETVPGYAMTPLTALPALAEELGLRAFYVKDESRRFGLNAFKGLGGSYAVARILSARLGAADACLPYERLREKCKGVPQPLTFVTATDGNHGRGVAWAARIMGQRAVVYLPAGSADERVQNIRRQGAQAFVTEWGYDETVRYAVRQAEENGWILVQDTALAGYEEIPRLIMQGYTTMALEIGEQLEQPPSHLFLQAGVGSMAGAVAAFFSGRYGAACPRIVVVEPDGADCFYRTAAADDGALHAAQEPLHSIMAGLCCGEVCPPAWQILSKTADAFVAMPDSAAALGMRVLAAPLPGDPAIVSGESGAAGAGLAVSLMRRKELAALRDRLGLGRDSRVLCISTEGATDRENYRRIVWDGAYGTAPTARG